MVKTPTTAEKVKKKQEVDLPPSAKVKNKQEDDLHFSVKPAKQLRKANNKIVNI